MKNRLILGIVSGALLWLQGCLSPEAPDQEAQPELPSAEAPRHGLDLRGKDVKKASGYYRGQYIEYLIVNGKNIWQGDILLRDDEISPSLAASKESGALILGRQWPGRVIPYVFDAGLPAAMRTEITSAMEHFWGSFKFVTRTTERDYVRFKPDDDVCASSMGRIGGEQFVTVPDWCFRYTLVHELGHTLGLFHEQSRRDRDTYLKVDVSNVKSELRDNFATYVAQGLAGQDMYPFDFNSIMLYGSMVPTSWLLDSNGSNTVMRRITPAGNITFSNQITGLSAADIRTLDRSHAMPGWVYVAAAARSASKLAAFAADAAGNLKMSRWTGTTSADLAYGPWTAVPGMTETSAELTAVVRDENTMDLFMAGHGNRIYTVQYNSTKFPGSGWSPVKTIPGIEVEFDTRIEAVATDANTVHVFAVDRQRNLRTFTVNAAQGIGAVSAFGDRTVISNFGPKVIKSGRYLFAFRIDENGRVGLRRWNAGTWEAWRDLACIVGPATEIAAASRSENSVHVLVAGLNRNLAHLQWNGSSQSINAHITGLLGTESLATGKRIGFVATNSSRLDAFVVQSDRRVLWGTYTSSWQPFLTLNNEDVGYGHQLAAIGRDGRYVELFVAGKTGVKTNRFHTSNGLWDGWRLMPAL